MAVLCVIAGASHAAGSDDAVGIALVRARPAAPAPPDLARIAGALAHDDAVARADFAWIALDEMAGAYEAEVVRAATARDTAKIRRWRAATGLYASHLRALAGAIDLDTPVSVHVSPPATVQVQVREVAVVISGPRITGPDFMAARIVERYCGIRTCPEPPGKAGATPGMHLPAPRVRAIWSFSAGRGPICLTDGGLELRFRDAAHLDLKRTACLVIARELTGLAEALGAAVVNGVALDWAAVRITSLGPGKPEHVALNGQGDYLLLGAPALAASPILWQHALPWVRSRVRGAPYLQSFPHAERLLAHLIGDPDSPAR